MSVLKQNIYIKIVTQIISNVDETEIKYMPPKYIHKSQLLSPIQNAVLKHSQDQQLTERAKDEQKDVQMWSKIYGRVSPEDYVARALIYATTKPSCPIFTSANTFRIKQILTILNNGLLPSQAKEYFVELYAKFQRTYTAFTKLAILWRLKHTPVRIQTDLYMNDLNPADPKTFILLNPGGVYYFSINNISRIIVDSITHQQGMFVEPLIAKNPYTNYPLSKADLFNIYFSMKFRNMKIPEFMEKYFSCEFNIYEFRCRYETELRDNAIRQYVRTSSAQELYYDIGDMLSFHKMTKLIKVDSEFPKTKLADTMRPYLELYFLERYSFSSMTRKYACKKLNIELKRFLIANPLYGKRILPTLTSSSEERSPRESFSTSALRESTEGTRTPWTFQTTTTQPIFCEAKPRNVEQFYTVSRGMGRYCISHYMKTHIYDEDIFEAYVDQGDVFETYNAENESWMPSFVDAQEEQDDWHSEQEEPQASPFFVENILTNERESSRPVIISMHTQAQSGLSPNRALLPRPTSVRIQPESDSETQETESQETEDVVVESDSETESQEIEDVVVERESDTESQDTEYEINDDDGSIS